MNKKNISCQLKQLSSNPKIHIPKSLKKLQENRINETKENGNSSNKHVFESQPLEKLDSVCRLEKNLPTPIRLNQTSSLLFFT